PFATARGLVGKGLMVTLPEAVISIGANIPVARFVMPGAGDTEAMVREMLDLTDVFMMPGNGILAIGADLEQAYLRAELLEHLCKIDFYTQQMGTPMALDESDRQALLQKRTALGLGPTAPTDTHQMVRQIIEEELRKILK
ncbi:MAG: class II aldolase/adducin family protein, partial [Pseudomonadota bacterium]